MANGDAPALEAQRPRATGRLIVRFSPDMERAQRFRMLADMVGMETAARVVPSADEADGEPATAAFLARLGLGCVPLPGELGPGRLMQELEAAPGILSARPEFFLFNTSAHRDTAEAIWGVHTVGADRSPFTGRGIKLAILDTGLDLDHPDFAGRRIVHRSFVEGEGVDDVQGHGTHCAGTAAGSVRTEGGTRYGVAPDAELHIAKVLSDRGAGREGDILAGLVWAADEGCAVISMSLGRTVRPGEARTPEYEEAASYALDRGALVLAAAGNDSRREYGLIAPVSEPANAPSILAVGALDPMLHVAPFSNGGIDGQGGEVDLAAPGVGILSTVPMPRRYASFDGTSMACPHAAGIAALWAESDPRLRGRALGEALILATRTLDLPGRDVGAGLVRAPVEETVPTT